MAATIELQELREQIRDRGDRRAPFISDSELNGYINASLQQLYNKISHHDESRYLQTSNINVVPNTRSYTLPTDFLRAVNFLIPETNAPTGFISAHRIMWRDQYLYGFPIAARQEDTNYSIRGGSIYLFPTPSFTVTCVLEYIPTLTALTAEDDTFDGIHGWEEWAVLDVLIKCAIKAEDSTVSLERLLQRQESSMFQEDEQDTAAPKTVVNVQGRRQFVRYGV